jgi:protein TonB
MSKKIFKYSFLASLILHLALALIFWVAPQTSPPRNQISRNQIEFIDLKDVPATPHQKTKEDQIKGQIVDQNEQALNDDIDPKTKYLSRHNQVVIRETRAEVSGKFKNTPDTGGKAQPLKQVGQTEKIKSQPTNQIADQPPQKAAEPPAPKTPQLTTYNNGLEVSPSLKDLTPSFKIVPKAANFAPNVAIGGGRGPSASDDHIDAPKGMQTLLSTREFVYYAYYGRIKDRLRQYWEPKIKEKMTKVMRQGRTLASVEDRLTKVIITLDQKGTLIKVQVLDGSGVQDLDDAAVEAFRAAAPFPNPPKGIIDPDGTIKIRWDFVLEA